MAVEFDSGHNTGNPGTRIRETSHAALDETVAKLKPHQTYDPADHWGKRPESIMRPGSSLRDLSG
jgi:hypothetical protein